MDLKSVSEHNLINKAMTKVILEKFIIDGYFDLSDFASNNINKNILLSKIDSRELKEIIDFKKINLLEKLNLIEEKGIFDLGFNDMEATFFVYLILQEVGIKEEKIKFIIQWLIMHTKEEKINNVGNIIYCVDKVHIEFIKNVSNYLEKIYSICDHEIYYRGHGNCNYKLIPSIMRNNQLYSNEDIMNKEVLINCPEDFQNQNTTLEKLVMMQHYGLPTRLLDITLNPLVGLYFACANDLKNTGELIVLKPNEIKYFDDDEVIVLSCLSKLNEQEKTELLKWYDRKDNKVSKTLNKFMMFIKQSRGEVLSILNHDLICSTVAVKSVKHNQRIVSQNGLFLICGLNEDKQLKKLHDFRIKLNEKTIIYLIEPKVKSKILEELDILSINNSTLFPEIENKTKYIKEKYIGYNT